MSPYTYPNNQVDYKYIVTDLLTDSVLAEIPFKDVTYGRSIRDAGTFSGAIDVIEANDYLDIYENTMPGRTSLYILRNGVCVWGGIIWSRTYDIKNRSLQVNADEFTSYLHHRVVWKTWNQEMDAKVSTTSTAGELHVQTTGGDGYNFTAGMPLEVSFADANFETYTNYYTVKSSPTPNATSFYVTVTASQLLPIPPMTSIPALVYVTTDTYDYLRNLLSYMNIDFSNTAFAQDEIAPAQQYFIDIVSYSRASGKATITTDVDHNLIPGQIVEVQNVPVSGISGSKIKVLTTPSSTSFTYSSLGINIGTTPISGTPKNVVTKKVEAQVVTLTTSTTHGFDVNDIVIVSNISSELNGTFAISAVPTTNTFEYYVDSTVDDISEIDLQTKGTATVGPILKYGTYGSYTNHSDINIDVQTQDYSGKNIKTDTLRGAKLTNIGDHLDEYSNTIDGFEYRIDCSYNKATNTFSKTFVVLPIDFPDAPPAGEVSPIERFGAEKIVFEHPGNILEASMEENAADSATRFWVQGDKGDMGEGASLPYAGVAATGMLADGWPILDLVEQYQTDDEFILAEYAQRYLEESTPPVSNFTITVNGSVIPEVGTYVPGDWCSVIIDDVFVQLRMASGLEPRDQVLVRKIDAFTVTVPNSPAFPESVSLELVRESQVDKLGY